MSNSLKSTDLDALYYQSHSQPQQDRAQELLQLLSISETASVLDVGCGCGNIIADISKRAPKGNSIGIDASHEMIKLAKQTYPREKFSNLEFQEVKAEEMSFPDFSFDAVISFSCLLWVREPRKALDLMCKSLKSGGELLILTYLKESAYISFFEKTLDKKFPSYKGQSAARSMLSIKEYQEVLESNRMKLEVFRPEWRFSKYKNVEALKAYIKGWLNSYVSLPLALHDTFLEIAAEESFSESVAHTKDEIVLPYQLLAIKARKPY